MWISIFDIFSVVSLIINVIQILNWKVPAYHDSFKVFCFGKFKLSLKHFPSHTCRLYHSLFCIRICKSLLEFKWTTTTNLIVEVSYFYFNVILVNALNSLIEKGRHTLDKFLFSRNRWISWSIHKIALVNFQLKINTHWCQIL